MIIKFGTTESEATVNLASKQCQMFALINILESSATIITTNDWVMNLPDKPLIRVDNTECFTLFMTQNLYNLIFCILGPQSNQYLTLAKNVYQL